MGWSFKYYSQDVKDAVESLDSDQLADLRRIRKILHEIGPRGLTTKQSKDLDDGLYEFRLQGDETTARVFYCYLRGQTVVYLHVLAAKKTNKTPAKDMNLARKRLKEVKDADARRE